MKYQAVKQVLHRWQIKKREHFALSLNLSCNTIIAMLKEHKISSGASSQSMMILKVTPGNKTFSPSIEKLIREKSSQSTAWGKVIRDSKPSKNYSIDVVCVCCAQRGTAKFVPARVNLFPTSYEDQVFPVSKFSTNRQFHVDRCINGFCDSKNSWEMKNFKFGSLPHPERATSFNWNTRGMEDSIKFCSVPTKESTFEINNWNRPFSSRQSLAQVDANTLKSNINNGIYLDTSQKSAFPHRIRTPENSNNFASVSPTLLIPSSVQTGILQTHVSGKSIIANQSKVDPISSVQELPTQIKDMTDILDDGLTDLNIVSLNQSSTESFEFEHEMKTNSQDVESLATGTKKSNIYRSASMSKRVESSETQSLTNFCTNGLNGIQHSSISPVRKKICQKKPFIKSKVAKKVKITKTVVCRSSKIKQETAVKIENLNAFLTPKFLKRFREFSKGAHSNVSRLLISKAKNLCWLRTAKILGASDISEQHATKNFVNAAGMKISMNEYDYIEYLLNMTKGKIEQSDLINRMSECTPPTPKMANLMKNSVIDSCLSFSTPDLRSLWMKCSQSPDIK